MNTKDQEAEFDHPPTPEELAAAYRQSRKSDPTSMEYERVLIRPKLHPARVCVFALAVIIAALSASFVTYVCSSSVLYAILVGVSAVLIFAVIFAKHILIWLVKVYQRLAPAKLRNRCRYEPSCSQYMIMSIEKHGAFKGLIKGLKRWHGCKPPNGGVDFP